MEIILTIAAISLPTLLMVWYVRKNAADFKNAVWLPNENQYKDPATDKRVSFPSLYGPASVYLSVVVPSYNEEERLSIMLDEALEYLHTRKKENSSFTYEILIIDDGSKDKTSQVAMDYCKKHESADTFRVLTLAKNRGKGGAVKRGMHCARGQYLLMVDADGATKFADLDRLESSLKKAERDGQGIALGSRAHLQAEAVAKRTLLRTILMYGFHTLVYVLGVHGIKDTQCGFKLFTRKSAQMLFKNLHVERWAFDVELIYLAQQFKIHLTEVAVNWTEIPGSKLTPMAASLQMGKDLFRIRASYILGLWTIDRSHFA